MAINIEIRRLINFETAADGTAARLVKVRAGRPVGIIVTVETLTALLMMTMPAMASSVFETGAGRPGVSHHIFGDRIWIEPSPGKVRILTLGTPQVCSISFSVSDELSLDLG